MGASKITEMKKTLISLIIATLFIIIIISPCNLAEEPKNLNQTLTIWMPKVTQDDYFKQIQVSSEDLQVFIDNLNDLFTIINTTRSPASKDGVTITKEEWQQISIVVNDIIDSIKSFDDYFPNINIEQLISDMIDAFFTPLGGILKPKPIFSVGIGFSWIPFYDYESFLGILFRPIFTRYIFGFSRVGGILEKHFKMGCYNLIELCFSGLFINFGDIGREKIIGPTMYIGTVLFYKM